MTPCYLAVDPRDRATTVAVGMENVADLDDITVREYPGTGVEEAVRLFLTQARIDAADVICTVYVFEPGSDFANHKALENRVLGAVGRGPVIGIDRREATLRGHLEGAAAATAALAVLTMGDASRGQRPTVDLQGAEALLAADPVSFERWAVYRLGGMVDDWDLADRGVDGVLWCPGQDTTGPDRFLVAVKGGAHHDAQMVRDLAAAVGAHDATGGVLLFMTKPSPEVYEAARSSSADRSAGPDGVPFVQILTIPEVLGGKRPAGVVA